MVTPAYDASRTTGARQATARRPTITDVARAAGVSIAVVSYALNGRPGVSAATRERVLRVADEFGWRPSAAARSLRTGPRAVALVVDRTAASSAHATELLELVTALQDVVAARGLALLLQVVDDAQAAVALYGSWWAERRFDVMVVTDVLAQDPRVDALRRLRAPAVVVGPPQAVHELACVHVDEDDAYRRVGRYLLELGHRDVAAITGPGALLRTRSRVAALRTVVEPAGGQVVHEATTSTPEAAAVATRRLLTSPTPPTALVHDSDQMALAALDVARRTGRAVPWDLSVVAGADSALCHLSTPALTTLPSVQAEVGTATGEVVLAVLDGETSAARTVVAGALAIRGSTGPRAR